MKKHEVIIIGGGPGGATLAALLAKQKVDVAIFERANFPRFHIGESLLPSSMPIFKESGFYETLSSGKYIQKFGARFVDCNSQDEVYFGFEEGFNADIPSAFEVERSEFDKDILENAKKQGATLYQPERVKDVQFFEDHCVVTTSKGEQYEAKFVIDSTGRDAMLGKQNKLRKVHPDLNNVAVFAHYTGVKRNEGKHEGDIMIGMLPEKAWTWVIPFKGEVTSVGVVCNSSIFNGGTNLEEYLNDMLGKSSRIKDKMANAERITEITVISNYSHVSESYAGKRWMLIGDAAVFLDPMFSSGVHVSVTSAKMASKVILKCLNEKLTFEDENLGKKYKEDLDRGVDRFHSLINLFYQGDFVRDMKKTLTLENTRKGFTSAVAGDMWNEDNFILQRKVL